MSELTRDQIEERMTWKAWGAAAIKYLDEKDAKLDRLAAENAALREKVGLYEAALHCCFAATGHEAGDADDFRALTDREIHTVNAVSELRELHDAAQEKLAAAEAAMQWRPEVRAFASVMEARLKANDYKGGWKHETITYLLSGVERELRELAKAFLARESKAHIEHEAADIANFAMMAADVYQQPLPPAPGGER